MAAIKKLLKTHSIIQCGLGTTISVDSPGHQENRFLVGWSGTDLHPQDFQTARTRTTQSFLPIDKHHAVAVRIGISSHRDFLAILDQTRRHTIDIFCGIENPRVHWTLTKLRKRKFVSSADEVSTIGRCRRRK